MTDAEVVEYAYLSGQRQAEDSREDNVRAILAAEKPKDGSA